MAALDDFLSLTRGELEKHLRWRVGGHVRWVGPKDVIHEVRRLVAFYWTGAVPPRARPYECVCGDALCVAPKHHKLGLWPSWAAQREAARLGAPKGKQAKAHAVTVIPDYRTGRCIVLPRS